MDDQVAEMEEIYKKVEQGKFRVAKPDTISQMQKEGKELNDNDQMIKVNLNFDEDGEANEQEVILIMESSDDED